MLSKEEIKEIYEKVMNEPKTVREFIEKNKNNYRIIEVIYKDKDGQTVSIYDTLHGYNTWGKEYKGVMDYEYCDVEEQTAEQFQGFLNHDLRGMDIAADEKFCILSIDSIPLTLEELRTLNKAAAIMREINSQFEVEDLPYAIDIINKFFKNQRFPHCD